jgi:hypothetical protein
LARREKSAGKAASVSSGNTCKHSGVLVAPNRRLVPATTGGPVAQKKVNKGVPFCLFVCLLFHKVGAFGGLKTSKKCLSP